MRAGPGRGCRAPREPRIHNHARQYGAGACATSSDERGTLTQASRGATSTSTSRFKQPHHPSLRAKRSNPSRRAKEEWIASSLALLAMTPRHNFAISRRDAPEVCQNPSPRKEGVGNAGCLLHPQPRVQNVESTRVFTTGTAGSPGAPARNGFNGFLRAPR
jgi:hypothetical protein